MTCLVVALAPVIQTLIGGHLNFVILACFLWPIFLSRYRMIVVYGLAISIGFWIKIYPICMIFLFLSHRESRSIATLMIGFIFALGLISLIWIPLSLHVEYFTNFFPTIMKFTIPQHSQSLVAQLFYLKGSTLKINAWDIQYISLTLRIFNNSFMLLGFVMAMVRWRHAKITKNTKLELESVAILLLTIVLCSPLAWGHHFVFVIPAMALLVMELNEHISYLKQYLIVICWISLSIPSWTLFPHILFELPGGHFIATWFDIRYTLSALCMFILLIILRLRSDIQCLSCKH